MLRQPSTTPTRCARVWAALTCPTSGDVLLSAAPGYEFPDWGGARHVRRRQPRLAAPRRLARRAALLRRRRPPSATAARGRSPTSRRWCSRHFGAGVAFRADDRRGLRGAGRRGAAPPAQAHARAPRRCASRRTGCSSCASRPSARAATSSTSRSSRRLVHGAGVRLRRRRDRWRSSSRWRNNFVWNRALDVPRRRRARGLPGGALLRRLARRVRVQPRRAVRARRRSSASPEVPAQAIAIVAATPLNFVGNKLWSFSDVSARGVLRRAADAPARCRAGGRAAQRRRPRRRSPPAPPAVGADDARRPRDRRRAAGRRLTAAQVGAIADRGRRGPRASGAEYPGSTREVFLKGTDRWQVSYFANVRRASRARRSRRCSSTTARARCSRRGPATRSPWTMARGYPGAFGRDRQLAVGVDPAARAVRGAVRRPAPAAGGCCTSTCSC